MNKFLKSILALGVALSLSIGTIEAKTATRKIDASTCETVYTNYYFFLEANTVGWFNQGPLSNIATENIAVYSNNSYLIKNFNMSNIGYGEVAVSATTTTTSDGITSMSLDDYYTYVLRASAANGAFTSGNKNYIFSHDWFSVNSNGSQSFNTNNLSVSGATKESLKAATVNATIEMSKLSTVSPTAENPFQIKVNRNYTGYLTGKPVTLEGNDWYFQPAVYYIQYCSPKASTPVVPTETYYNVYYKTGTTDLVVNMPSDSRHNTKNDMNIDSKTPERSGYKFLGWTTDSSSPVADPKFAPGSLYTDRKDLILYAVWQKIEETPKPVIPDNPQTGISDYLIPFGGAIGVSSLALGVLKKKKTFKQF